MPRQTFDPAGSPSHSQEPSTRRVNLGSPASDPSVAGEPPSSEREDEIFADLKARIGRLWEEGGGVEDIRAVLIGDRTSK